MEKTDFDAAFDDLVVGPLADAGFKSSGKSLILRDDLRTVALVRLGGRNAQPGQLAHVLCFRHTFLRDLSEAVPARAPSEPFDYPYKLLPAQLHRPGLSWWTYRPHNLRFPKEYFDWGSAEVSDVRAWLRALHNLMRDQVLPWSVALSPERALSEIELFGEQAWCERLWISDYQQYLSLR